MREMAAADIYRLASGIAICVPWLKYATEIAKFP